MCLADLLEKRQSEMSDDHKGVLPKDIVTLTSLFVITPDMSFMMLVLLQLASA